MNAEELAERQYGLISRAQARSLMSESAIDRRISNGRFVVVHPGVYRVVGAPVSARQRALAAAFWAGDDAAISHCTAARLLRLPGIPHDALHLTIPYGRGLRAETLRVHHARLTRADRTIVDTIPCTAAARTLIDCAPFVDAETLEVAFERARRLGLVSSTAVAAHLTRGRPGAALRAILSDAAARPKESRLEVKLARLLRKSGLPEPVAQFVIGQYRVDFAWAWLRLVCECDGFEWHGNHLQWKRDRRRIASIEAAGWRVVHVTWEDVTRRPSETIERISLAVRAAAG